MADGSNPIHAQGRLLSGTDALVELMLEQRRRDRLLGLSTAGFVSGYRGSPLGGVDEAMWARRADLDAHDIRFQPGLNEDLAATAVWGTQQVGLFPGATVEGVFGLWYGKGPGVDRSLDALKHGNAAGSSRHGGVLLVAGDDHGCVSSTLPHQSGPVFASAMIPTLNPASVEETIAYGLTALALSRYSGCWVGLTGATEVIETTALVDLSRLPATAAGPTNDLGDLWIRLVDTPLEQERRLHGPKMQAVAAFADAAGLDRWSLGGPGARLVIVTTGKAYGDVREALRLIDLPEPELVRLGLAVFKVGLAWPLQPHVALAVSGSVETLIVEEKRGFIEDQLVRLLYNAPADRRPGVVGKADEVGRPLLPTDGELSALQLARLIAERLARIVGAPVLLRERTEAAAMAASTTIRKPYFCAGCPHSTSTKLPEGSRAMGGIGCHGMATWMPDRNTQLLTHMGAEGVTWIGQAPFTTESHVFQNMGDGTYNHSGLLAIRAATAAGVNITYKVLYNDAVAMTGGQPHEGALTVDAIARQLIAEGLARVVVVAETLNSATRQRLPPGVAYHPRAELDAVQRSLRDIPGVTALIYDQTCAAELRRRRRKGEAPLRSKHLVINPAVCEGCGDCSVQSNCIAIEPLETELGRKRRIDPNSCNQDYSCLEGFCPSFVAVEVPAGALGKSRTVAGPPQNLPAPDVNFVGGPFSIMVAGIGGTGVVTVANLLAAAAGHDGLEVRLMSVTGLAQKNGAVQSHVRFGPAEDLHAARIGAGGADLIIACDLIAASTPATAGALAPEGVVVANGHVTPTADFIRNGRLNLGGEPALRALRSRAAGLDIIDAVALAERHAGGGLAANVLLLGYAWQLGRVPLSHAAMQAALAASSGARANATAFQWGRAAALGRLGASPIVAPERPDLGTLIQRRADFLTAYQNRAYAERYRQTVGRMAELEQEQTGAKGELALAVAEGLFRLMACKDEYEVARLQLSQTFAADLRARFGDSVRPSYYLAPSWLGPRKRRFGPWIRPLFQVLASARRLRGTPLDPFRYTAERRAEQGLLAAYLGDLDLISTTLSPANHAVASLLAKAAIEVRGYGHVKQRTISEHAVVAANLRARLVA
jgi:indolepyruvate ferredoxin oxidoreductase